MTVPDLRLLSEADRPDAAALLADVEACVRRFCVLPNEHAYVAVTLWIATTHVLRAFDHAPRLVARSAEKRSGKSRLMEVVAGLVHAALRTVRSTRGISSRTGGATAASTSVTLPDSTTTSSAAIAGSGCRVSALAEGAASWAAPAEATRAKSGYPPARSRSRYANGWRRRTCLTLS